MSDSSIEAILAEYKAAVAQNANDFYAHHHLGMYYYTQQQLPAAITHFTAALQAQPGFLSAHYHLGVLYLQQQQHDLAALRFLSVVELDAQHLPAHFYLGVIALHAAEVERAEIYFQRVLALDAQHIPSLMNLGAVALQREDGQTAIAYFTQVLVLEDHNLAARKNLAATFLHYDHYENALTHYFLLRSAHGLDVEDRYNMGVAYMALGQFTEATAAYQHVLQEMPQHTAALNNLATLYIRQGQRARAIPLLQHVLQLSPEDTSSQFMLNVLEQQQPQPQVSQTYIKNLFDHYALHYEAHLQRTLGYTLPEYCVEILRQLPARTYRNAVDLGCGTGLSGVMLRDYCENLVGVDISAKMLAQAQQKNCYVTLIATDILSYLRDTTAGYDLIQLLDVLPYFGELDTLLTALVSRLNPEGMLIMSAEISAGESWKIQDSLRFCHAVTYIEEMSHQHGLQCLHFSKIVARQEHGGGLHETFFVYTKPADLP